MLSNSYLCGGHSLFIVKYKHFLLMFITINLGPVYNGTQHPINPTYPPFNQRPTTPPFNSNINQRPTNPTYPPFNNNPNQYHPTDPRNPTSNIGNFNHNFNDTRTTTYRPFQSKLRYFNVFIFKNKTF